MYSKSNRISPHFSGLSLLHFLLLPHRLEHSFAFIILAIIRYYHCYRSLLISHFSAMILLYLFISLSYSPLAVVDSFRFSTWKFNVVSLSFWIVDCIERFFVSIESQNHNFANIWKFEMHSLAHNLNDTHAMWMSNCENFECHTLEDRMKARDETEKMQSKNGNEKTEKNNI